MAKKIPEFIPETKLFAEQLNATWQAIAMNALLGIDEVTKLPKALFDIGDIDEVVGGSMVNDMIARNDGQLSVYDSAGLAVGAVNWETLLNAGVSLYPAGYMKGFIPTRDSTGQKLTIGAGKCRSSDDTTNFDVTSLGQKSLMATWAEGFGASVGSMVGGNHYLDNGVAMTAYNLPSGELCFSTSVYNSTYAAWRPFTQLYMSYADMCASPLTPTLPWYLGRKNNQGIIKAIEIGQTPNYQFTGTNIQGYAGPLDFDIVGSNSTITDQSSFNSASWTTLASFTGQTWVGCKRNIFECSSNTTNWAWVGIKVTAKQTSQNFISIGKLSFLNATAINELKEVRSTEYKQWLPYHVFVIYNPIANTYDWCVDTSPLGANILSNSAITAAGFTKFRRVYSFACKTGQIIPAFTAYERTHGALQIIYTDMDTIFNPNITMNSTDTRETLITDLYAPRDIDLLLDITVNSLTPGGSGKYSNYTLSEQNLRDTSGSSSTMPAHYQHYSYSPVAQFFFRDMFTKCASIKFTEGSGTMYGFNVGYTDMRL